MSLKCIHRVFFLLLSLSVKPTLGFLKGPVPVPARHIVVPRRASFCSQTRFGTIERCYNPAHAPSNKSRTRLHHSVFYINGQSTSFSDAIPMRAPLFLRLKSGKHGINALAGMINHLGEYLQAQKSRRQRELTRFLTIFKEKIRHLNENAADRVTLLGSAVNLILSFAKFVVGTSCHSSVLVADAVHSMSDLLSDFVTLWAVRLGRLPPDEKHPQGYGKFEALGSLFLALTLFATGLSVGVGACNKVASTLCHGVLGSSSTSSVFGEVPGALALVVAGVSILSKEYLYRITNKVGQELKCSVLVANALHHRSDAWSSVLALISIGIAMSIPGMLVCDAAAGVLVAGMILNMGKDILKESIDQLTDTNDIELAKEIEELLVDEESVTSIQTSRAGSSAIVRFSLSIPIDQPYLLAAQVQEYKELLRHLIMKKFKNVSDVVIQTKYSCHPQTALEERKEHLYDTVFETISDEVQRWRNKEEEGRRALFDPYERDLREIPTFYQSMDLTTASQYPSLSVTMKKHSNCQQDQVFLLPNNSTGLFGV